MIDALTECRFWGATTMVIACAYLAADWWMLRRIKRSLRRSERRIARKVDELMKGQSEGDWWKGGGHD